MRMALRHKKIEDGHFSCNVEAPDEVLNAIEAEGAVNIYSLHYFEETLQDTEKTIRVYSTERDVNLLSLLSSKLPSETDEIALDRMFAENNDIVVGDSIQLRGETLQVTGLIASPDYSCLFENNADMIFDSINFSVAVMSESGFQDFASVHMTYNYAWRYPEAIEQTDVETAKAKSDDLIDVIETVLTDYNTQLATSEGDQAELVDDYRLSAALSQSSD